MGWRGLGGSARDRLRTPCAFHRRLAKPYAGTRKEVASLPICRGGLAMACHATFCRSLSRECRAGVQRGSCALIGPPFAVPCSALAHDRLACQEGAGLPVGFCDAAAASAIRLPVFPAAVSAPSSLSGAASVCRCRSAAAVWRNAAPAPLRFHSVGRAAVPGLSAPMGSAARDARPSQLGAARWTGAAMRTARPHPSPPPGCSCGVPSPLIQSTVPILAGLRPGRQNTCTLTP